MFIMALVLTGAFGFMEKHTADGLRSDLATATERANSNATQLKLTRQELDRANGLLHTTIDKHNIEISALFAQSEANRARATADARKLLDQAAIWADHNTSRAAVKRSVICEERLQNINQYLDTYIREVRDVATR
jgi:hypothetical protein